ncbi:hypothetical protein ACE38W_06155 [Chitinophaga sp. Hz27]|uniref:hypothetical protein n=1 Tax=Chitinophaga sp. Hz27 TaxID=3347169 RepID=UPI0035D6E8B9
MQTSDASMKRKFNFVFYYAIISTSVFLLFILSSFVLKDKTLTADEITVKRIMVVGEDGTTPRVVISNETRQHSGRLDGKDMPPRQRDAGIIFFNNTGEECGGLCFGVKKEDNTLYHGVYMTMDNYRNDQVIFIQNSETYRNGEREISRGININEYPAGALPLGAAIEKLKQIDSIKDPKEKEAQFNAFIEKDGPRRRLFLGRTENNNNGLFLTDSNGHPKLDLYVDKNGNPRIDVIDSTGHRKNILH